MPSEMSNTLKEPNEVSATAVTKPRFKTCPLTKLKEMDLTHHGKIEGVYNLGQNSEWVNVKYAFPNPSNDDWIGVFSPANFSRQYLVPICKLFKCRLQHNRKGCTEASVNKPERSFSFALFSWGLQKMTVSNPFC